MFQLGVITDEVTQDLSEALSFAKKYGMSCVELRSVWDKSVFEFRKEDVKRMQDILSPSGISVIALSSSLFKCSFWDKNAVRSNIEGFQRAVDWAYMLGAKYIRGFDFWADKENPVPLESRAEAIQALLPFIDGSGIEIVIESDPSVTSYCPSKIAELLKKINDSRVGAVYEPGNCLYIPGSENPFPEGYNAVYPFIKHVHIKDAVIRDGKTIPTSVGEGDADYPRIFAALIRDGFEGCVVLETHHRINSNIDENLLRLPAGTAFSDGGKLASEISAMNLVKMIKELRHP